MSVSVSSFPNFYSPLRSSPPFPKPTYALPSQKKQFPFLYAASTHINTHKYARKRQTLYQEVGQLSGEIYVTILLSLRSKAEGKTTTTTIMNNTDFSSKETRRENIFLSIVILTPQNYVYGNCTPAPLAMVSSYFALSDLGSCQNDKLGMN